METNENNDIGIRIASIIGLLLVLVGMVNNIPSIPGLESMIGEIFRTDSVLIRKFPYDEYPLKFILLKRISLSKYSCF